MSHVFTTHRPNRASLGALAALDFGLQVRIEAHPAQRTIFSAPKELPIQVPTSELAEMVSELRVRSFALRHVLEQLTSAVLVNVECGFWPLAERAALDLSSLLSESRTRRLADPEPCDRASNGALRVAELCAQELL